MTINDLIFYGTEENPPTGDHSVDTTFKSRFNNPQLTGVQVLVDGATGVGTNQISGGPDPSGNDAPMTSPNKYWTLNGTLTSNLAVEANTFLEGDQPHAVSVWFNSSNLEANVSNTCVFSIASEEKLDSVNLDLQSNTWHNLTYAYQGEGGSRVTYLDGRKVSEDQAEDTFGDYPPFAMTGYSQGGYVVSESSFAGSVGTAPAWKAFDDLPLVTGSDIAAPYWQSITDTYETSGSYNWISGPGATGVQFTDTNGGQHSGEWIKLEMPHKLKLSYISYLSTYTNYMPKNFVILGSNDDNTWTLLKSVTGGTAVEDVYHDLAINADRSYKYYVWLTSAITGTGGEVLFANIKYYGHRENDLVRLPDPTNVLKYPHIYGNFSGYAQRGYIVSDSTHNLGAKRFGWELFNGDNQWQAFSVNSQSAALQGYDITGDFNANTSAPLHTADSVNYYGHWVKIKMPRKIKVSQIYLKTYADSTSAPDRVAFLVSNNDGSTWSTLLGNTALTVSDAERYLTPTDTTNYWQTFLFIVTSKNGNVNLSAKGLAYIGTEENSSIPIQIGGGNIDKVANFRVYDKFIGEDQALEIWDAQKDEFGRAKPQMVLQQGKLGIGTDAPQGSLSVADEPHVPEEFPPRAMTDYKTYFEGHGEFCVSASSVLSDTYKSWYVFSDTGRDVHSDSWLSAMNRYTLNGYIDVDPSVAANINGVYGEWLELKLPYKITLDHVTIQSRAGSPYGRPGGPAAGNLWGSNDGVNWTLLKSFTGLTYGGLALATGVPESVLVNSITPYSYFRLQPTKRVGVNGTDGWIGFGELSYFGTREQGQSVLHDGQLTLTKSLNVPRIGPPLDADDTPRRDRLVVEYNTSTNPTFEGAVRDTSGRGNDGVFVGTAAYNANEKALVFDGDADYVESPPLGWSGAQPHSVSVWIKLDQMTNPNSTSIQNAWTIVHGGTTNRVSHFHIFTTGKIEWAFNGNNATTGVGQIEAGTWYHIVCVYNGGAGNATISRRMWINGQEKSWNSLGSSSTLNLEPEATFALGYNKQLNNYDHDGSVSNAKLYDTALTASEVKTLYDMGRTGSVANPQPLHISGPVNVMGDIRYITSHPLALPTMWDHMANGNCAKSVYPIVGTQGGSKVYNVYCEPDLAGGGWMCMAQISRNGYQVRSHPTDGDLDLFTKSIGDSKNIRWDNTFAVPINILSNNSGYDLDVMVYVSGGSLASRYEGGMRLGAVWRGANLAQAFNPGRVSGIVDRSGLATSDDGYGFTSRTPVTGGNYGIQTSGSWYYAIAGSSGVQGGYNDYGYSDGGWILHQGGTSNHVGKLYGGLHKDDGTAENMSNSTNWVCARIFVRPSIY
jgi:hypothetical protein